MLPRFIRVKNVLALAIIVFTVGTYAPQLAAQADNPKLHNRVICIKTKDKAPIFVDLPDHCDLGSPSISPDGKTVALDALLLPAARTRETWLIGIDGKGLRKLAKGGTPRWSPDGKRLMIARDKPGAPRQGNVVRSLIEIDLATGGEHVRGDGRYPDWSPDGKQLVFSDWGERAPTNAGLHTGAIIYIAKANGDDPHELVAGSWPSWSPDGKKIAYHNIEGGFPVFYIINLATKKQERIGVGYFRAQWASDSRSFVSNTLMPVGDKWERYPAQFFLDKPEKPQLILAEYDTALSPCLSRDGKTMAFIVDSHNINEQSEKTEN